MQCRLGCGACCIAPSISTSIPGMPQGKPAGVRCIQLDDNNLCLLFGSDLRPQVCGDFAASADVCGQSDADALWLITELETMTGTGEIRCN
ncbi:YkgJ family cysteine cluster protein [Shewanella sp. NIFS-20-20]|uniref:YkgJ family cysteine cluster protein n=1 Tax=Shewanella sp. NIFS-20-20 TaxID=2853806 RepID=UPI001C48C68E|nr:YkgJ family cysteine cluster protein [Shewanella sp. NIFS-20-20]MBV7317493.1 YkgJ family cysteine cluster protein [Shewanella sp. NIFS-20-20]